MLNNGSQIYVGIVEDRNDHLKLGRCKVRVVGLHTQDKEVLPTKDLPWAMIMMPASSAGVSGIGAAPVGPVEGTTVIVMYHDPPYNQQPIIIGSLQGIPQEMSIINDTLEVQPMFRDDITSAPRAIPVNYEQATALQQTPFEPGGLDPLQEVLFDDLLTSASNMTAYLLDPSGLYKDVLEGALQSLYSGIEFIPSMISKFSGTVDQLSLIAGEMGSLMGSVSQVLTNVDLTIKVITNSPVVDIEAFVSIFEVDDLGNFISPLYPSFVSAINDATGGLMESIPNPGNWELCASVDYNFQSFEELLEWSSNCLSTVCSNLLIQELMDHFDIYNIDDLYLLTPEQLLFALPEIIERAIACNMSGGGGGGGGYNSTLEYTCHPTLSLPNVSEIVNGITGLGINPDGTVSGPLFNGFLQGVTSSAMVVAKTVEDAVLGPVKAAAAFVEQSIDQIKDYAKSAQAVLSIAYPAWTLVSGNYNFPPELPPPTGIFAEAGKKAILSFVYPLKDITNLLTLSVDRPSEPAVLRSMSTNTSNSAGEASAGPDPVDANAPSSGGGPFGIPLEPPPKIKDKREERIEGIKALVAACEKYEFNKTKEQICAVLAICGGECHWIPKHESCYWSSPDRLMNTFKSAFRGDRGLAEAYTKCQHPTDDTFFEFVYSYRNDKGKELGNRQKGDGEKYHGRGFIQLTGRANYELYATKSGYDIVTNPDLLVTDKNISAEVAVIYLKDRVQKTVPPASSPGFFEAAARAVNGSYDIEKKRDYYDWFYQSPSRESLQYCNKTAGAEPPNSVTGQAGGHHEITGDTGRFPAGHPVYGFSDPNNKYPLHNTIHVPDSNPLARGSAKGTIVSKKEETRKRGIRLPFSQGFIDQPPPAYGAKYPYNHMMETESGHIQEFDDTPGAERIHTYHRSGTFTEIDSGGTQVNRIVGDNYTIVDKNGIIYIEGNANVHVEGSINIYCHTDANVHTEGSLNLEVGQHLRVKTFGDLELAVGGQFKLWSTKGNYFQTDAFTQMFSKNKFYNFCVEDMHLITASELLMQSGGMTHLWGGDDVNIDAETNVYINCKKAKHIGDDERLSKDMDLQPLAVASKGSVQCHREKGQDVIADPIPTFHEEQFHYELPEDYSSPGGTLNNNTMLKQNGEHNLFPGETSAPTGGSSENEVPLQPDPSTGEPVDRPEAPAANVPKFDDPGKYTKDFRLSTHFTLGQLITGDHRLVAQQGLTLQQIVTNLANLAQNILEPLLYDPKTGVERNILPDGVAGMGRLWQINSGFRVGSGKSQHNKGMAVDFGLNPATPNRKQKTFELIKEVEKVIPYDQLILEYRGAHSCWIHASYNVSGGRRMAFTMNNDKSIGSGFTLLS